MFKMCQRCVFNNQWCLLLVVVCFEVLLLGERGQGILEVEVRHVLFLLFVVVSLIDVLLIFRF